MNSSKQIIYDISPTISPQIGVWPKDTPFRRNVALNTDGGDNITLSSIETTLHLGAHTDAPNHYAQNAPDMASRSLHYYLGEVQVITVPCKFGQRILLSHLNTDIVAERVLFKTESFPNPNQWNADFMALSAELIHFLHDAGVILVGIDTPSIDLQDDKVLESHSAVHSHDMAILEGIVLTDIEDGIYELIALPLKVEAADASPVRAILRTYNEG